MKILVLTHGFPPDQMAGAEIYAFRLALEMQRRGADIVVLSPGQSEGRPEHRVYEENYEGLRVLRLQNSFRENHRLELTYAHPEVIAEIEGVLDEERPDVVHVHHVIGTAACAPRLAKTRGAVVVTTLHDFWYHCARGQRITLRDHLCEEVQPARCALCIGKKRGRYGFDWTRAYLAGKAREVVDESLAKRLVTFPYRFLREVAREGGPAPIVRRIEAMDDGLAAADRILAPSEFIGARYLERGLDPAKVLHWPYGMDLNHLENRRRPDRAPDAPLRFGFVGTLLRSKGIEILIEAFQGLEVGAASLDIYGAASGPDARSYEAELRATGARDDITFHGRFDNQEIAEVLMSFDVLCIPSLWWENAPLTLHEAAAARMPVVTTGHGGMAEFVERFGNGLTFRPGDARDLRRTLKRFMDEDGLVSALSQPKRKIRNVSDDASALCELYRELGAPE